MTLCSLRRAVLAIFVVAVCVPAYAAASQASRLSAKFEPDRVGTTATIEIGFQLGVGNDQQPPSALIGVEILLPAGVSFSTSELGLATCSLRALEKGGLDKCSPNAVMGHGSALVAVPDGPFTIYESVKLTVLMGLPTDKHTALLFYATGSSPVLAQFVFPSVLLGDSGPFGTDLDTTVQPIPGLPGEPDTRVVRMNMNIGPMGLTYYKHVNGAIVAFVPQGIALPPKCPAGGFPFAARFIFQNHALESATSAAPCPHAVEHVSSDPRPQGER